MNAVLIRTKNREEELFAPPSLQSELKDCLQELRHNQMLFDLETEPELIEQRIYEYQALLCRYSYLQRRARAAGLRVPQ